MKENRLYDVIGKIDAKFIEEADLSTAKKKRPRLLMLAAALISVCTVSLVGFTVANKFYYAPGVGIVDSSMLEVPQVWAAYDKVMLGDAKIDAVVLGEGEDGYNLTVWVWRGDDAAVEIPDELSEQGIAPDELSDFTLTIDGVKYNQGGASLATRGFSTYTFIKLPFAENVTFTNSDGVSVDVALKPVDESEYSYLRGIAITKDMSFAAVPITGTNHVYAARLTSELHSAIAEEANSSNVYLSVIVSHDDGTIGTAGGWSELSGIKTRNDGYFDVSKQSYGKSITGISPYRFSISHNFIPASSYNYDFPGKSPTAKVEIPEFGGGYDCHELIYETQGISFYITRVEYGENGFLVTLDAEGYEDIPYLDSVNGNCVEARGSKLDELTPGDTVDVELLSIYFYYTAEDADIRNPSLESTFGTIKLK